MNCQKIFLVVLLASAVMAPSALSQSPVSNGQRATLELGTGVNTYRGPANLLYREPGSSDVRLRSAAMWISGTFPVFTERIQFRLLAGVSGIDGSRGRAILGQSGGVNPFLTEKVFWFEPAAVVRLRTGRRHLFSPYVFAGFAGILADPFGESGQFDTPGAGIPGPERSSFTLPVGAGVDLRLTRNVWIFVEGARSPHLNYVFRQESAFPRIRRSRASLGLRFDIQGTRKHRYARRHFHVSPTQVHVDYRQAEAQIGIDAERIKWLVTSDASWISLDSWFGTGASRIKATIRENPWTEARTGVVRVSIEGRVETVQIHQAGRPPPRTFLDVSPDRLRVPVHAGSSVVSVNANESWEAVSSVSWMTLEPMSTVVWIQHTENESILPRSGTVNVSTSGLSRSIEIVQSGRVPHLEPFDVAPEWLDISSIAQVDTVRVQPVGAEWRPVSAVPWLTVEPFNDRMIIRSDPNSRYEPRIGMIEVTSRGTGAIVIVTQAAASRPPVRLDIHPAPLVLSSAAGMEILNVASSVPDWGVESDAAWLTLERRDSTVVVRFENNPSVGGRTTGISFSAGDLDRIVLVTQSGQSPPPIDPDLLIDVSDSPDCVLIGLHPVAFESNSTELTPAAQANLSLNVQMLQDCPSRIVEIDVALDPDEDEAERKRVERITAIRNYYLRNGISEVRLVQDLGQSNERQPE